MDLLIDNFYFTFDKKRLYTKYGYITLSSYTRYTSSFNDSISMTLHEREKIEKDQHSYKITDFINLPFNKIILKKEGLNYIDEIIAALLMIYLVNYFKYIRLKTIIPVNKKRVLLLTSFSRYDLLKGSIYTRLYTEGGWESSKSYWEDMDSKRAIITLEIKKEELIIYESN